MGPTNKTWHKEMRDFRINPLFEYCCKQWSVMGHDDDNESFFDGGDSSSSSLTLCATRSTRRLMAVEDEGPLTVPRVLIAYGSETGTAEAAAGRLGRALRAVRPVVVALNSVAGLDIVKKNRITHLIVLCSTFGKG